MKKNLLALVVVSVILFMSPHAMPGQTTGFRYDSKLDESRMVLDGKYELVFRLYDAATSGRQIATEIWLSDVVVADGSFRVVLDFGPVSFTDGGDRYIEFAFRPAGTDVPLATTTTRQKVMSVPYAIKSLDADTAATATNALQLAGVAAEQYVKTDDPRLKGPKVPEPANATSNFVLNTTTLQQSSNFHISGDGRASGSLSGGIVNATSRFTIGVAGNHVLSAPGFKNLFAGAGAGEANTTGSRNSFFGADAGQANLDAIQNSFFGAGAGSASTIGSQNAFFGARSGERNISGSQNTLLGSFSDVGPDDLIYATAIGARARVDQSNSLVLGSIRNFNGCSQPCDTVKVGIGTPAPEKGLHMKGVGDQEIMIESSDAGGTKWTMQSSAGSTNGRFEIVNRTSNANRFTILSGGNVGIGTTAPTERLQVVGNQLITGNLNVGGTINGNFTGTIATASNALNLGGVPAAQYVQTNDIRLTDARSPLAGSGYYIQNQNAAPQATSNFNIGGMGTAGIFNAASQFNIAGQRVLSSNADNFNFSAGTFAGSTAVGEGNSFFGFQAGALNIGSANSFFGAGSGATNGGLGNAFFGAASGNSNTTGHDNAFFGRDAGRFNTTANSNSFFGSWAGRSNTTGGGNAFFGGGAGQVNETGQSNSFFGNFAGESNTIGSRNTFFGSDAGRTNTTGGNNTILGFFADLGANNLTNATAIGYRARVDASDSLVLGSIDGINSATSTTRVGIGTTTPTERLHVVGNSIVSGNLMVGGTITGTFNGTITTADNALNLGGLPAAQFVQTTDPRMSDARDPLAGSPAYVQNQSVGPQPATNFNISGSGSAVVFNASTQYNIGGERMLSTPGVENLFLGFHAGFSNTTGSGNAFFGRQAGFSNTTGGSNAFFGPGAGYSNTSGGSNSFFGSGAGQNTSTGVQNVFIGREAGGANSTGSNNTIIGSFATLGSGALRNASAIGALAQADSSNSLILGSVNGVNGANETVKVGIGTTAPTERLHVVGNQLITGDLNVGGAIVGNFSGTISNAVNADNLGGIPAAQYAQVSAVDNLDAANITSGTLSNARLGVVPTANGGTGLATPGPGGHFLRSNGSIWISSPMQSSDFPANNPSYIQNTTSLQISSNFNISGNGTADSFDAGSHYAIGGIRVLGATAGLSQNTFAGLLAGNSNPTGSSNSFFGFNAGTNASSGNQNSFFGARAGQATSAGSANSFFGTSAGQANVADGNSFFGNAAGLLNTLGGHNTFIGREAGRNNTEGFDNTFVGKDAGDTNTGGFRNTVIGESADVMSAGLTNATAIGSRAAVAQSNSLVLGSINGVNFAAADTHVGIGTTTPRTKLDVTGGDIFLGTPGKAVILRSPDGGCWSLSVNNTGALTTVSVICP